MNTKASEVREKEILELTNHRNVLNRSHRESCIEYGRCFAEAKEKKRHADSLGYAVSLVEGEIGKLNDEK